MTTNQHPIMTLRLTFSTAADMPRMRTAVAPDKRKQVDPEGHVADRLTTAFNRAVTEGSAAILSDDRGNVVGLTVAYHCHLAQSPGAGQPHDHTNFGTSLSYLPGYKISSIVISALALREWLICPPAGETSAGIAPDNTASIKVYHDALKWEKVEDKARLKPVMGATWHTLPDPNDPSGLAPRNDAPDDLAGVGWYLCGGEALKTQARLLLRILDDGGIVNGKAGAVKVDLSALTAAGLTRARLEAIAQGGTTRERVLKMAV